MGCDGISCKKLESPGCVDPRFDDCPLEPIKCIWDNVCPKIREITQCSKGGIKGYTTYELSLELKKDTFNIYAIYGNKDNTMYVPPAKNTYSILGTNIGGVNPIYYEKYHSIAKYDSWLTIGITNGDKNKELSSIGIQFDPWNEDTPLIIDDGAIFLLDARKKVVKDNVYIIGHLTVKNNLNDKLIINAQGYKRINKKRLVPWNDYDIIFPIKPLVKDGSNGH